MATFLSKIFYWTLHTSVFAACCAVALSHAALLLFGASAPVAFWPVYLLVGGGTLIEYNVHHLFNYKLNAHMAPWDEQHVIWHLIVTIAGFAMALMACTQLSVEVMAILAVSGLLAIAYSTPLLPFRFKKRLKDYGLLKIVVLTGVWVIVTTLLPAAYLGYWGGMLWAEMVLRTLLIFPLCIAFDVRDMENDLHHEIHTLPNTIGHMASTRLADTSLLLFLVLGCGWYISRHIPGMAAVVAISAIAARAAIRYSLRRPGPFAYLFLIDGAMLLYGLLSIISYMILS